MITAAPSVTPAISPAESSASATAQDVGSLRMVRATKVDHTLPDAALAAARQALERLRKEIQCDPTPNEAAALYRASRVLAEATTLLASRGTTGQERELAERLADFDRSLLAWREERDRLIAHLTDRESRAAGEESDIRALHAILNRWERDLHKREIANARLSTILRQREAMVIAATAAWQGRFAAVACAYPDFGPARRRGFLGRPLGGISYGGAGHA